MKWCKYRSSLCDLEDPKPTDCFICVLHRYVDAVNELTKVLKELLEVCGEGG